MKMAFDEAVFETAVAETQETFPYVFKTLARQVAQELVAIKNSEPGKQMSIHDVRRKALTAASIANPDHTRGYNHLMIRYMSLMKSGVDT